MKYNKGDIFTKYGLVFKDNDEPDPKGKRPVMLMLAISQDSRYFYYLTLTSQLDHYVFHKDSYYYAKKTPENHLMKSSLINLQSIYKEPVQKKTTIAFIQPDEYKQIIAKFRNWQNKHPDEYYAEVSRMLS